MDSIGIDMGLVRGVIAVTSLATFLGICWWAYRPGNRGRFEADGRLVFESEEEMRPARVRTRAAEDGEGTR